jgi:hypothetical protein
MIFICSSCEELNIQTADTEVAVIESYLLPGNEFQMSVKKQLIFQSDDTNYQSISNLDIRMYKDGEEYLLLENEEGVYSNPEVVIEDGSIYSFNFEWAEKETQAETIIPEKPQGFALSDESLVGFTMSFGSGFTEPDEVSAEWTNENNIYHMIVVENIESDPVLINDTTMRPPMNFRSMPTLNEEQTLSAREFMYYGTHRVILYSLNPEYAELYEQLSNSSLDITAPPTNIENGLGIFTGVNTDTLYIEVN